ncbi:two-component system sensor histidine kinase NtrB [Paracoccus luteus]|uniref:two-component system sensor histidine kinase NtrB n=1 Tax=Paracoccus luteus TaxID=2508543 RepID=UPI0010700D4F|nr:ATP-binding protein [Paracoccus luteus]
MTPAQGRVAAPDAVDAAGFAALPLPVVMFDERGRFLRLNDAAEHWLNLSSRFVRGLSPDDPSLFARLRVAVEVPALLAAAAASEEPVHRRRLTFQIGDRAGGWTLRRAAVHLSALPGGGFVAAIIPDGDGAEPPRRGARAAIGMAEMLAHEIKNPLAGIRGAAQLLRDGLAPEDRDLADLIVAESRRIVTLMEQVERFGDTSPPRLAAVNIHDVLDRARRIFELTGRAPRIVSDYDPSLPLARVDADAMAQLVQNLLRNAAEALDRAAGPDPLIRIRTAYDGTVRADGGQPLPLQVDIEDNGPGVPDAIADQIFEPFISGRENGTGLGLALVGKIVTDHGARIRVDSQPGRTLFRLSLPRAAPADRANRPEGDR